jgi:hypothetical protein
VGSDCADQKGVINLMELLEIRAHEKDKLKFDLVMKDRVYELQAPAFSLRQEWMNVCSAMSNVTASGEVGGIDYLREGYLAKQSGGNTTAKKWDKRYFRLRCDDTAQNLQYFRDASSTAALGTVSLEDVTAVRSVVEEVSGGGPLLAARFEVKTHARTFVFGETAGSDEGAKGLWVQALRQACGLEDHDEGPLGGMLVSVTLNAPKLGMVIANTLAGDAEPEAEENTRGKGVVVIEVVEGSEAEKQGIKVGDRMHRINGANISLSLGHKVRSNRHQCPPWFFIHSPPSNAYPYFIFVIRAISSFTNSPFSPSCIQLLMCLSL